MTMSRSRETRNKTSLSLLLRLLVASLLVLASGASARRAIGRSSDRSSSSPSVTPLPPLARLVTSYHGAAPTGEVIPRAGRGTFPEFLQDLKLAADAKQISRRPIEFVFGEGSFALDCGGLWLEFGVYDGTTLGMAAEWRRAHCGAGAPPVFGFDTFEGLPETWDQGDGGDTWERGSFDLRGKLPAVPDNAMLVKGLFSETLPRFLSEVRGLARHREGGASAAPDGGGGGGGEGGAGRRSGGGRRGSGASDGASDAPAAPASDRGSAPEGASSALEAHVNPSGVGAAGAAPSYGYRGSPRASYVHVDCDLYAGARDALSLLSPLIRPGTVLVFDDLVNYPRYRDHEVKALWEWIASTGLHLRVVGAKGPLPDLPEDETTEKGEEEGSGGGTSGAEGGGGESGGGKSGGGKSGGEGDGSEQQQTPSPPPRKPRAVDLEPKRAAPHHHQSVAFVVV